MKKQHNIISIFKIMGRAFEFLFTKNPDYSMVLTGKGTKKSRTSGGEILIRLLENGKRLAIVFRKYKSDNRNTTMGSIRAMDHKMGELDSRFKGIWKYNYGQSLQIYREKGNKKQYIDFGSEDDPTKVAGTDPEDPITYFKIFVVDEPDDINSDSTPEQSRKDRIAHQHMWKTYGRHAPEDDPMLIRYWGNPNNENAWWIQEYFIKHAGINFRSKKLIELLDDPKKGKFSYYDPKFEYDPNTGKYKSLYVAIMSYHVNEFAKPSDKAMCLRLRDEWKSGGNDDYLSICLGTFSDNVAYVLWDVSEKIETVPENEKQNYTEFSVVADYGINDEFPVVTLMISKDYKKIALKNIEVFKGERISDTTEKTLRELEWGENFVNYLNDADKNKNIQMVNIDSQIGFMTTIQSAVRNNNNLDSEFIEKWSIPGLYENFDGLKQEYDLKSRPETLRAFIINKMLYAWTEEERAVMEETLKWVKQESSDKNPTAPNMDMYDLIFYCIIVAQEMFSIEEQQIEMKKHG